MRVVRERRFTEIVQGFFLLTHPGPVTLFISIVAVLALRASWPNPAWTTIILLIAAHAAMQFSISMINDYCDRQLDAASRPNKPIVRGYILPQEALIVGILMIGLMVILLLPLNPLALLVSFCYLALGQAYNLKLKSTPWSGVILALMISLIPLYVFAGVNRTSPVAFWLVLVGFLLGMALNIANSLPDLEEDAAGGAKTLAVSLGIKRSFVVCPLLILSVIALIGILTTFQFVPAQIWIIAPLLIIAFLAVGAMILFFGPGKPVATRKIYFYLAELTCFAIAAGWIIGVKL